MTRGRLPPEPKALVDELAAMVGVVSVVLGGSRATGEAGPGSDWDLSAAPSEPGALVTWVAGVEAALDAP
jgi:predicted nucleotidyltransferase